MTHDKPESSAPVISARRPRAGRPSRAQQRERAAELLDIALDTFLDKGFEATTVEEIAGALGMSKRTVYARFPDKTALFRAAVQEAVDRYTVPFDENARHETDDLRETLIRLARLRIARLAEPSSIKLQRILNAYADRFPEMAQAAISQGTGPTIDYLEDLLRRHVAAGTIETTNPRLAATAFLSLVVGGAARLILLGGAPDADEMETRLTFAVDLFWKGVGGR